MSSEWAIRVHNLSKTYRLYDRPSDRGKQWLLPAVQKCLGRDPEQYYREVHAVKNVSFEVKKGEPLGIIGRNGSGKSTLLQLIVGTLGPTHGSVEINGRVAALLELGAGFHPEFTGRENVYLNAALLGLSREDVDVQLDDILAFADIGIAADQPVKTYSSGMIVRLAFAVIAHVKADILIIDEALAVGDAFFVQKCMRFLRAFMEYGTVLFVSHDSAAVLSLCRNALWLDCGRVAGLGEAKRVCDRYLNPQASQENVPLNAMFGESETRAVSDDGTGAQWRETSGEFGERRACIEKVALKDASGRALHTVQARARVSLLVWCRTSIQLLSPIVGFFVRDRLGQALFGANTCVVGQGASSSTIAPGMRFVAELEFVMPVLQAGDYTVSVALAEGTQEHHVQQHWIHDALTFNSSPSELCFGLIAVELLHVELHRLVTQDSHNENANNSVAL